jgi:hypothetical protein
MNELRYIGNVTEGKLKIVNRKAFDIDMQGFEGSRVIITLKKYRKSRSNKQNAYYHGCVIPYVIDGLVAMGTNKNLLSSENVHEMLKAKFLGEDIANENGEFIRINRSTTDLTTTEFMEYIADIQQWAAEFLSIQIPDPGEQADMQFDT